MEAALLAHIAATFRDRAGNVTLPPGDDMGAIRLASGAEVLAGVDQLADGTHIDLAEATTAEAAHKAIARSLSDVAAMAAEPRGALATAALPRDWNEEKGRALSDALAERAAHWGCPLFGGDLLRWDGRLHVTVTVLAEAEPPAPIRRSGARPGEGVYVTGALGGSGEASEGKRPRHLTFEPRLAAARYLRRVGAATAMIDLSDGLGIDAARLAAASGVALELDAARLPVAAEAHRAAERDGTEAWRHAVADGEDHELLFTASDEAAARLGAAVEGVAVTRIGHAVRGRPGRPAATLRAPDGETIDATRLGWLH